MFSMVVFLLVAIIATTYLWPTIYADLRFVSDYDYDEGVTGSWAEAYAEGWQEDGYIYDIWHDDDFDFAQGCYGNTDYEWRPEEQYEDGWYGTTEREIWVWQDGDFKEHLEAFAYIGDIM